MNPPRTSRGNGATRGARRAQLDPSTPVDYEAAMQLRRGLTFMAFGVGLAASAKARATATVYPEGTYARPRHDAMTVTWDAATKTEHLDMSLMFEGDVETMLFIVPTPTQPVVERPRPAVVADTWKLTLATPERASGETPLERVTVRDIAVESQKFDSTEALAKWIDEHGFAKRGALLEWAERYIRRSSVFNMIRLTEGTKGRREIALQPVRLSFRADQPFAPYFEPEPDFAAHTAFLERAGVCVAGTPCSAPWHRELEILVVASSPARIATSGVESLLLTQALEVPSERLPPLGSASFPLDAKRVPRWALTHFSDSSSTHTGSEDVVFVPISGAWAGSSTTRGSTGGLVARGNHRSRTLFAGLAIGLVLAVLYAIKAAQRRDG